MKRLRPLRPLSSLLALAAVLGCGETTTNPRTQLTFDRPVDMAFACHGGLRITNGAQATFDQPIETTAMPTSACAIRAQALVELPVQCQPVNTSTARLTEQQTPPGQETLRDLGTTDKPLCVEKSKVPASSWYGLVLESGPGTVNVVEFGISPPHASDGDFTGTVIDSDPLTPGVNGISVGEEPVAIVTDPAGCHAITANAGSCDLSVLELNSALDENRGARVDRIEVKNASGTPIHARPTAMVVGPSIVEVGKTCPAQPTGLVYVAYPSCHLVAGIDASTGAIVSGIQYDAAGVPSVVGGNVTCPEECGKEGSGAVTAGVRPVALDLEVDPRLSTKRLVIGADNSASITVVELDDALRPSSLFQVALEDKTGKLGVSAIALSLEIGMGGGNSAVLDVVDDEAAGGSFQFVYAVATDGTVRVADVLDVRKECDTQVDPRYARNVTSISDRSCFPVGAATTPPRRPGVRGPGIQLPSAAIPLSVDFVRVDNLATLGITEPRMGDVPGTWIGYFAVVTSSNGATYVVNVDDDDYPDDFLPNAPLSVSMPLTLAHQLRDARGNRFLTIDDEDLPYRMPTEDNMSDNSGDNKPCDYNGKFEGTSAVGGARAAGTPERKPPTDTVATAKLTELPGFRQILCDRLDRHGRKKADVKQDGTDVDYKAISEVQYAVPSATRDAAFPDLMALSEAETWSLVWEGSLSLNTGDTAINGPAIRESMLKVDSYGMHVLDDTRPFCDAGVEPFDILQLRGCDPSAGVADCPSGYTCFVHPESKISGRGACMLRDEADRLAMACKDYLTSARRYTVATAASGELLALPRRVELRTTPLDGCVDNAQCESLADYAARQKSSLHPINDTTAPDPHPWTCEDDPLRAPKAGTGKRCELRCNQTEECVEGTVCQGGIVNPMPGDPKKGFCMEGVIPPQACINASQQYELHAGEAFAVIGSRSGFVHPIIEGAGGACVRDPMASPLTIGRLPLMPHDPLAPNTVRLCDPTADPLTGQLPGGGFEPNPCVTTVAHTDVQLNYSDTQSCTLDPNNGSSLVERQAPAVRFRNRGVTFSLVDPYYPGDEKCILDRKGTLGQKIPQVVSGFALSFRQVGGFVPMQVFGGLAAEDRPSFPVKVVRGPANTVWVVDEGDFLSTSASSPSTRGKVLRLEPLAPGLGVTLK